MTESSKLLNKELLSEILGKEVLEVQYKLSDKVAFINNCFSYTLVGDKPRGTYIVDEYLLLKYASRYAKHWSISLNISNFDTILIYKECYGQTTPSYCDKEFHGNTMWNQLIDACQWILDNKDQQ